VLAEHLGAAPGPRPTARDGEHYIDTVPKHGYRFIAPGQHRSGGCCMARLRPPDSSQRGAKPVGEGLPGRAAAMALSALAGAGASVGVVGSSTSRLSNARRRNRPIAVFPFRTLGGSKDDEYLGIGSGGRG